MIDNRKHIKIALMEANKAFYEKPRFKLFNLIMKSYIVITIVILIFYILL